MVPFELWQTCILARDWYLNKDPNEESIFAYLFAIQERDTL